MSSNSIDSIQSDTQRNDALELERRRALQGDESRASQDLAARQAQDLQPTSGDDLSAQAVSDASNQQTRGAEWQQYSDSVDTTVPVSVTELHEQSKKVDQSESASETAKDDANRQMQQRDTQERLTVAEIQAEATKKSGVIRA